MGVEVLNSKKHTAKVKHICDLCGGTINIGERYQADFCVDGGDSYTFKAHEKCLTIANEIYEYLDLDEEMDRMNFCDGCAEVCGVFVCPDCVEYGSCKRTFCTDKMDQFFGHYELYIAERQGNNKVWKVRERPMPF